MLVETLTDLVVEHAIIADGVHALQRRAPSRPQTAILLGSGLAGLRDSTEIETFLKYEAIPGFPSPTAIGHSGRLSWVGLDGFPLLLLEGRSHLYEGIHASAVRLPLRILHLLGIRNLIVTNAAGGLHPDFNVGDVVVLTDCLNATFTNPLAGADDEQWGPRFPDMSCPFDPQLTEWALDAACAANLRATPGVYAAVTGPNYETRAEQRMFRRMGVDAIGMSTVPEVIVAAQLGWRVLGLSTITNCCRPDHPEPTDGSTVVHAAAAAVDHVLAIARTVIRRLAPG